MLNGSPRKQAALITAAMFGEIVALAVFLAVITHLIGPLFIVAAGMAGGGYLVYLIILSTIEDSKP